MNYNIFKKKSHKDSPIEQAHFILAVKIIHSTALTFHHERMKKLVTDIN